MRAWVTGESSSNRARAPQLGRGRPPKRSARSSASRRAAERVDPIAASRWAVLGPIPGTRPAARPANRSQACSRRQDDEPARLLGVARRPWPRACWGRSRSSSAARSCLDLATSRAHRRVRGRQSRSVSRPRRARSPRRARLRPDDRHHLARALAVVGEVRRRGTRLRASPLARAAGIAEPTPNYGPRRRRWSPPTGGRCRPRPPVARAARGAAQLDRDVERVHVEMSDAAAPHAPEATRGARRQRLPQHNSALDAGPDRCRRRRTRARCGC